VELARIDAILVLKAAGFSLAQIRDVLAGRSVDLADILELQRQAVARRRDALERSLGYIDRAIALIKAGRRLDLDTLCHLIRSVNMDKARNPYGPLIDRYFSPAQKERLASRPWSAEDQAAIEKEWADVFVEAGRLMAAHAEPTSPEALAVAERSLKLVEAFTQGDPGISQSLNSMYGDWIGGTARTTDGSPPPPLPFGDQALWTFLGAAQAAWRQRRKC
jgi:DNA-binding transcriptional MerR regulator